MDQSKDLAMQYALLKAGFKRKPKLKPQEHARRLAIEQALQQERYCNAFALWRRCRHKVCRRRRACCGDQNACLRNALDSVPRALQRQIRQDMLSATPRNVGAPEREARKFMPRDFYE